PGWSRVSPHGDDLIRISRTARSDMTAGKTCPDCGERLSVIAFDASARSADGLARTCRACTNARRRRRERSGHRRPAARAPAPAGRPGPVDGPGDGAPPG